MFLQYKCRENQQKLIKNNLVCRRTLCTSTTNNDYYAQSDCCVTLITLMTHFEVSYQLNDDDSNVSRMCKHGRPIGIPK